MNLFLNALEAMPNQGTLSISAEKVEGAVLVRISDTGCGISSDNIGKIFDPFYTTSPPGRGIGLGLSICHSVVKQHFGSIEVNSVEGEGSRFVVRLPVL
jgi:signal transduction histidine kinase